MVKTEILNINGNEVQSVLIHSPGGEGHPNMIVLVCKHGYIMCGYLNQEAAANFGDTACVIGEALLRIFLQIRLKRYYLRQRSSVLKLE